MAWKRSSAAAALLAVRVCFAEPAPARIEAAEPVMGTLFRVTAYGSDADAAKTAIDAAFGRARQIEATISDYIASSELRRLTDAPPHTWTPVSGDLFRVLDQAQRIARASSGAFDITVGPLVDLWRQARRDRVLPEAGMLAGARRRTGFRKIELESRHRWVRLRAAGMRLDPGGIGKGYAADEMLQLLRERGFLSALVAAGGDLAVGDPPPGASGWRVGIDSLGARGDSAFSRTLTLRNCAVSTSGDAEQYVEIDGRRYSHIVDPRTGYGVTDRTAVTVIAPTGLDADPLATAMSVLGARRAMALADSIPGVAALAVTPPGDTVRTVASRRWPRGEAQLKPAPASAPLSHLRARRPRGTTAPPQTAAR